MKFQNKKDTSHYSLTVPPNFPPLWSHVLDEVIPSFVKARFSPQQSWKDKPFSQEDVVFFSKGLVELSEFFTFDREGAKLPNYFTTARFRSSYFLYFFALQGAKFLTLFERYTQAVDAAIAHAEKNGKMTVVDVGSGPGTASIAFLVHLLQRWKSEQKDTGEKVKLPFPIELIWIDYNGTILKDGELFLNNLLDWCSEDFDGDIQLKTHPRSWWSHEKEFQFEHSLVLLGNVLNETPHQPKYFLQGLAPFFKKPTGGGVLMVEPAFRTASQRLSQIRDELMPHPLWGPCLHTQACPLSDSRDWCHFSVPSKLPGAFFKKFSVKLGGVRDWLKFSFVWVAAKAETNPAVITEDRYPFTRVLSDPIRRSQGLQNQICRPERIDWVNTPKVFGSDHEKTKKSLKRGDAIYHDSVLQSKNSDPRNREGSRGPVRRPRIQK